MLAWMLRLNRDRRSCIAVSVSVVISVSCSIRGGGRDDKVAGSLRFHDVTVSDGGAHLHNEALGFPSATQNEISEKDATTLLMNGCKLVAEGANMPGALDATRMFLQAGILYGPAKAANAGGVATSGLEMAQNSIGLSWTCEEVDERLHKIMVQIRKKTFQTAGTYGRPGNLVYGANIAGFVKVADAMLDQGPQLT